MPTISSDNLLPPGADLWPRASPTRSVQSHKPGPKMPSKFERLQVSCLSLTNSYNKPNCCQEKNLFIFWFFRATMLITQLVPDAERFRIALRAVKLWAQGQGLYSNILGYLVTHLTFFSSILLAIFLVKTYIMRFVLTLRNMFFVYTYIHVTVLSH